MNPPRRQPISKDGFKNQPNQLGLPPTELGHPLRHNLAKLTQIEGSKVTPQAQFLKQS